MREVLLVAGGKAYRGGPLVETGGKVDKGGRLVETARFQLQGKESKAVEVPATEENRYLATEEE